MKPGLPCSYLILEFGQNLLTADTKKDYGTNRTFSFVLTSVSLAALLSVVHIEFPD